MLREFHQAFGISARTTPAWEDVGEEVRDLRIRLTLEEADEFDTAAREGDIVEVADALGDIVYVAYGSALSYGIDLDAVLVEVHRSNMSKLNAEGQPVLDEGGKVVKSDQYFKPDIAKVLGRDLPE